MTQPNLHSIPFAYQSHHPFHISSPTAAAESAFFGKFAGDQDTALSLDDLSEAQSTARPNRSAQKSRPAEMSKLQFGSTNGLTKSNFLSHYLYNFKQLLPDSNPLQAIYYQTEILNFIRP